MATTIHDIKWAKEQIEKLNAEMLKLEKTTDEENQWYARDAVENFLHPEVASLEEGEADDPLYYALRVRSKNRPNILYTIKSSFPYHSGSTIEVRDTDTGDTISVSPLVYLGAKVDNALNDFSKAEWYRLKYGDYLQRLEESFKKSIAEA